MKAMLAGAAVALTAGLLCGGAMKFDLTSNNLPAGPQPMAAASADMAAPAPDTSVAVTEARYVGKLPDYVLGTDALRPPAELISAPPTTDDDEAADGPADPAPEAESTPPARAIEISPQRIAYAASDDPDAAPDR